VQREVDHLFEALGRNGSELGFGRLARRAQRGVDAQKLVDVIHAPDGSGRLAAAIDAAFKPSR
jgi:hypothetical protein